jgi:hypothetical protein
MLRKLISIGDLTGHKISKTYLEYCGFGPTVKV